MGNTILFITQHYLNSYSNSYPNLNVHNYSGSCSGYSLVTIIWLAMLSQFIDLAPLPR